MPARPASRSRTLARSPGRSLCVAAAASLLATAALAPPAAADDPPGDATGGAAPGVTTLHLAVTVGADDDTGCDVVADLYLPPGATAERRVPAILMTDGFGGSKDGVAPMAQMLADQDYAVLAYSGLGFGGSSCPVSMNDPAVDGKAAQDLVSYLGGADGLAYLDAEHTEPAPVLDVVVADAEAHDGERHDHDPRVGMVGGSYGGAVQLAAASVDPRIDAVVPVNTWNDLAYSLFPNNTATTDGVSSSTPGAMKVNWALGLGLVAGVTGTGTDETQPLALLGCERSITAVCRTLVNGALRGYPAPRDLEVLRRVSPVDYLEDVRVPALLVQAEHDTLFNLDEAAATFETLRDQGTPTAMIWQRSGHSDGEPAPGDLDWAEPDPAQYVTGRVLTWFDRHLRDADVDTGPLFAYHRDWAEDDADPTGGAAFATSDTFPVAEPGASTLHLSSGGELVTDPGRVVAGTRGLATPPLGLPTSSDPADVLEDVLDGGLGTGNEADLPGTALTWTADPLDAALDVAGSPTLDLAVSAPGALLTQHLGARGQLVLFVKVLDVAPDGTATLVDRQVAPVRVPDASTPFTTRLPTLVHRFEAGHSVRVVVAAGSTNYRGGLFSNHVTVTTGDPGQALHLPTVEG